MSFSKPASFASSLLMLALVIGSPVQATECFDISPTLERDGDEYYRIEESDKLSKKDRRKLDLIYKKLEGNWKGEASQVTCMGSMKNPRERPDQITKQVKITVAKNGDLKIKSDDRSERKGSRKTNETVIKHSRLGVQVAIEGTNSFTVSKRNRIGGGPSQFLESIHRITLSGNQLTIVVENYVHGYLAAEEIWSLHR